MNTSLDVRTLVILTVNGDIPADEGIARIAEECGISAESLITALTSTKAKSVLASRRWTNEDDALIMSLWRKGESAGNIAKALRRTRNSVSQRVHFLRSQGHSLPKRETAGMNKIHQNRQQLRLF